ncbi:hypothetical protein [Caudoviricetes sp.]|nr:hypothetical protein [Caudoviricetes sp.]
MRKPGTVVPNLGAFLGANGYSDATLERLFGSHVHGLTRELILAGHAERDLGGRLRLTISGRALVRAAKGVRS